ncbi:MAG: short-chain fatty acyl-CoA regulator family protein [Pseudomonadota bacterium]
MVRSIVGTRIRERRRQIGLTQAALAERIGISASYLNLIEGNKRRIAGTLLRRTADALELSAEDLDGAAERRLAETLTEIGHLPALTQIGIEVDKIGEFIGRYPGWARAIAALVRSERDANRTARALADRMSHDPFLGETVHRMLSRVAAIRSASGILVEYDDIDDPQRRRFHRMIDEESRGLSDVGEALASYFERRDPVETRLTPQDEVEALFDTRRNRFPEIEGVATDPSALAARIEGVLSDHRQIETDAARSRAARALQLYARDAALMPLDIFEPAAQQARYDIECLAEKFSTGTDAVCRRLTALPPENGHPSFGYLRANAAGTIIDVRGLSGLNLPRYAAACPLWVLYRTQQRPEQVMCQHARFPNGHAFIFAARARNVAETGFGQPKHYLTDMLTLRVEESAATVYAPVSAREGEPVGPACRICPRTACAHRIEDPFGE